ncbi:MAG: Fur family transcriptional regulator [Henriciella sp.]
MSDLIQKCLDAGLSMTTARRAILRALENSEDHPDAFVLHDRAKAYDPTIAQATVYRTMRILEQEGLVEKHDFGNGRARYEEAEKAQHDHLINLSTGEIIEFQDPSLEVLKIEIAKRLGFHLKDHRLELYGVPRK